MKQWLSTVLRKYLAQRKLEQITRARRESFANQQYIRNRAAQVGRRKTKGLATPA